MSREAMDRMDETRKWGAFFASRLEGMETFREQVYRLGEDRSFPIWVSEHAAPELGSRSLDEVQLACLRMVRNCERFLCVLNGTYGSTEWSAAQLSILEFELAMAALARKEMTIFLLEPFDPDARLLSLMEIVRRSYPGVALVGPMSPQKVLREIERTMGSQAVPGRVRSGPAGVLSRLVRFLARWRSPELQENFNDLDVQFLDGQLAPLSQERPDPQLVAAILEQSKAEPSVPVRLARLWAGMRHLSAAPYEDPRFSEYLPLWERLLSLWASASAWYGFHGHWLAGRLAVVNTLLRIRTRMGSHGDARSIQGSQGAIASEYYSIAKLVEHWRDRRHLLHKALWNVERALETSDTDDRSGLLAIRGSIRMALWQMWGAVQDHEEVLCIRRHADEGPSRIGEAQSELGFSYFRTGRLLKAGPLLEEGVRNLELAKSYPFTVRALRKLGHYYRATLRFDKADEAFQRAWEIAERYELEGQVRQMKSHERAGTAESGE